MPTTPPSDTTSPRSRGQIIPKGDRRWLVRFYLGRDPRTGKRRYSASTVEGTRAQAQRELTRRLAEADAGAYREPTKQSLADYLTDMWLTERSADYRAGSLSGRSLTDYRGGVKKIIAVYGAVPMSALGKPQVAELRCLLLDQYTQAAASRAFDIFRAAIRRAYELDVIRENPALAVKRIPIVRPQTGVLDAEQVRHFLAAAVRYRGGRYSALLHVLLLGGLRPGEAVALRWEDLRGTSIRVTRAVTQDEHGTYIIGPTKTRETRSVVLPESALQALALHRERQGNEVYPVDSLAVQDGLLIPNICGGLMMVERARKVWKAVLKRAGLPKLRLYDARHTYVSALLHQGVDARTVADLAGHRDPAMTLRQYAHALPASKRSAVERLEAAVTGREGRA